MPEITVIIASRNRRESCARTVESALAQTGGEFEIIVVDDGSADDTADFIAERFPGVVVEKLRPGVGTSEARNVAARRARAPILAWIDDDAVFVEPDTLARVREEFEHPRIGAVAVPFVNHRDGHDERCVIPDVPDPRFVWLVQSFVGVACAMRRDIFLGLGGCDARLVHWAEEGEFCVRLHGAGYVIRIGTKGLIRHFPVPSKYNARSFRRMYRNSIYSVWLNVPALYAVPIVGGMFVRALLGAMKSPGQRLPAVAGLAWGMGSSLKAWPVRRPISRRAYRAWWEIRKRKPVRLEEIEPLLPPRIEFASAAPSPESSNAVALVSSS